ncbi:heat-inducible transcriptional repressor HrcA [Thioalbus denitrificans]|uniref:Heat-inducible transcription repressor HrcA n=1 Tax=Thioalbus denitrificans TaxID=547122 RepID=A0A369C5H4_9GAMM|nr:heat-inducible transcriptional repressor HrcA [Thioalbus denitrificans]RCX28318.1 heat-inducible transcription repressor HrcA [Thioalbus denitrificans]
MQTRKPHDSNDGGVDSSHLSDRARLLLKALVEQYIREGQPVGSRTLARTTGLNLSPATIRNVMSDLEELGFIRAPHTSAGRIPTAQGYRFFVDSMLTVKPLRSRELRELQERLQPDLNVKGLVASASALLSGVTRMAGVVTVPRRELMVLRQVEFLPLSDSRVLVILVLNEHEVQNRVIHTERPYTAGELQEAANYLNATYAGQDMVALRGKLLEAMQRDREQMDRMMLTAIEVAEKAFDDESGSGGDYIIAGEANLLQFGEFAATQQLRRLFEAFNHKRDLLKLLDRCLQAEGIQIFIGEETGREALGEVSLVTAPYSINDHVVGVLGVIGPTRMAYERVIPIVDVTARLLGAALKPKQ